MECRHLLAATANTRGNRSLADVELVDERAVTLDVDALQVVELATTLADELEQTTTGVVVFLVRLEVLGELRDAFAQKGDLNFGRTRVAFFGAVFLDDRGFMNGMEHVFFAASDRAYMLPSMTAV